MMLNTAIQFRHQIVGHEHIFGQEGILDKIYMNASANNTKLPNLLIYGFPSSGKHSFAVNYYQFYNRFCIQNGKKVDGDHQVKQLYGGEILAASWKDIIESVKLQNSNKKLLIVVKHAQMIMKHIQNHIMSTLNHKQIVIILIIDNNKMINIQPSLRKELIAIQFPQLSPIHGLKILIQTINNNAHLFNNNIDLDRTIESPQCLALMAQAYNGNVRALLNMLQFSITTGGFITLESVKAVLYISDSDCFDNESMLYDLLSGLQKAIRASDAQSAIFFTAALLKINAPINHVVRRLIVIAYEDIGLADPNAAVVALTCKQAVDTIGLPEGRIPLANCVIYLAKAPKNNDAYIAIKRAQQYIDGIAANYEALAPRDNYKNEPNAQYPYPHDLGTYILEKVAQKPVQDQMFYVQNQTIQPH